jgi:exoribonuclease R
MARFDPTLEDGFSNRSFRPAEFGDIRGFSQFPLTGYRLATVAPASGRSSPIAMTPTSREATKDIDLAEVSMREPLDSLSIELTRISAEIQSINSGFQEKMQETVALVRDEIENDYRLRMEKRISELRQQIRAELEVELRKAFDAELKAHGSQARLVQKEIERVLGQIQGVSNEIAAMLDDASIELSKVMRKRTEQAELKAYLDGLLFSVADQPQAKGAASL